MTQRTYIFVRRCGPTLGHSSLSAIYKIKNNIYRSHRRTITCCILIVSISIHSYTYNTPYYTPLYYADPTLTT